MKKILLALSLLCLATVLLQAREVIANQGIKLQFSTDAVFLDTVFSTVGSSTYQLRVFNPSSEKVVIDNISLGRGPASDYRINVNGTPTRQISEVEILPKDSIYIFIEVTNAVKGNTEMLYVDSILFNNKGTAQNVKLVTLTKPAYFHYPTNFVQLGNTVIPYSVIRGNQTWTGDKPHLIYGYALVDSGSVLNINTGAEVHFHQNSGLWIGNGGSLKVGANATNPGIDSVLFAGDRLEPFYEDIPGQWGGALGGIFLQGGSINNSISNAVIKNATTALRLDSTLTKNLDITYSYILNSSRTGIFGGYGNMDAHSLVVANAGVHLFYAFGGDYEFRQCTFANYWDQSTRTTAAVAISNYLDIQNDAGQNVRLVRDLSQADFGNCLIDGNNQQELTVLEDNGGNLELPDRSRYPQTRY
ncbi:MAG: hypothetical protein U5L96_13725 [Owenweeksia sp.]|nr:hypothetical protein [Owenweeksia sp.]